MKRKYILPLVLILTLVFTACTKKDEVSNTSNNKGANTSVSDTKESEDNKESTDSNDNKSEAAKFLGTDKVEFKAKSLKDEDIDQSIFKKSKLTLVNLWGTTCPPCLHEMPELEKLAASYDSENFQVLGIVLDTFMNAEGKIEGNVENANKVVGETGVNYTNLIPNETLFNTLKNVQVMPTTFFVDKEGNILGDVILGAKDEAGFKEYVEKYLQTLEK